MGIASTISAPAGCTTSLSPVAYMASMLAPAGPLARIANSEMEFIATDAAGPDRMRGVCCVMETARNRLCEAWCEACGLELEPPPLPATSPPTPDPTPPTPDPQSSHVP